MKIFKKNQTISFDNLAEEKKIKQETKTRKTLGLNTQTKQRKKKKRKTIEIHSKQAIKYYK